MQLTPAADYCAFLAEMPVGVDFHLHPAIGEDGLGHHGDEIHPVDLAAVLRPVVNRRPLGRAPTLDERHEEQKGDPDRTAQSSEEGTVGRA